MKTLKTFLFVATMMVVSIASTTNVFSQGLDDYFKVVKEFEITIPEDFSLDNFVREHKEDSKIGINEEEINENNFHPTVRLSGGVKKVKIVRVKDSKKVSFKDCINYIKSQKGIFPNAVGLAMVLELKREELPERQVIIYGFDDPSVDEKCLLVEDGVFQVPRIECHLSVTFYNDGSTDVYCSWSFITIPSNLGYWDDHYFLFFTKE